nr:PREDICTED: uncharacterized protein LOC100877792 isoform X1 [Megachile rotundata]
MDKKIGNSEDASATEVAMTLGRVLTRMFHLFVPPTIRWETSFCSFSVDSPVYPAADEPRHDFDTFHCVRSLLSRMFEAWEIVVSNRRKSLALLSRENLLLYPACLFEIHVERSWNNPSLQGKKIGCNYAYEPSVSIFPRIFRSDLEERELLLVPFDVKVDKEEFLCLPPYLSSFKNDFMQHSFRNFLHMHKVSPNRRCLNQLNS